MCDQVDQQKFGMIWIGLNRTPLWGSSSFFSCEFNFIEKLIIDPNFHSEVGFNPRMDLVTLIQVL